MPLSETPKPQLDLAARVSCATVSGKGHPTLPAPSPGRRRRSSAVRRRPSGAASSMPPPAPPVSGASSSGATSSGTTSSSILRARLRRRLLRLLRRRARSRSAVGRAGLFAALFEAVDRRPAPGILRAPGTAAVAASPSAAVSSRSAASFDFALGLRQFFGGGDEFGVAGGFVAGAPRSLRLFDHADVEVGDLGRSARRLRLPEAPTEPTAALTSAQIASPWVISSALLSAGVASVVSPARRRSCRRRRRRSRRATSAGRASSGERGQELGGLIGATLAERIDDFAGTSNCAPGTRTPTASSRARRAAITPGRKARPAGYRRRRRLRRSPKGRCRGRRCGRGRRRRRRRRRACGRASARSSERSTLRAPATRPSFRYQTENSPLVAVAAPDLLVPVLRRADVLEARPVGEVAEEVGHDVVVARRRRACCRRRACPAASPRPSARPGCRRPWTTLS